MVFIIFKRQRGRFEITEKVPLSAVDKTAARVEGSTLKLPPGTPRIPRFLEEGGRIPGPPCKSVRGGPRPSRVRPGGDTALDCCVPPLTTRYKQQIELLYVSRYLQFALTDLLRAFGLNPEVRLAIKKLIEIA